MISLFRKPAPIRSIIGRLNDTHQSLSIALPVLRHVGRYRQSTPWATEAGGQLFGVLNTGQICVTEASGPYAGDERSRYRYRSNPAAAQQSIEDQYKVGLLYLGEWHTHAEDNPIASSLDSDAMRRLITNSRLNSNALLMMIVGRQPGAAGLGMWSISSRSIFQWSLSESTEHR